MSVFFDLGLQTTMNVIFVINRSVGVTEGRDFLGSPCGPCIDTVPTTYWKTERPRRTTDHNGLIEHTDNGGFGAQ